MDEFPLFLREWVLWILRSILVASPASIAKRRWPCSSSMMAVACLFLVFLVFRTSRWVPDDCRQVGMRTLRSVQMLRVSIFTMNFGHYFYEPLVCRVFSSRHIALGGALDDEEFFIIEGSV